MAAMEVDDHTYSLCSGNRGPNEACCVLYHGFDKVIMDFMLEQGIPGAAFALSFKGKLLYRQGYGMAGAGRRATSESLFRIASVSKPITAIAVMKLVQEGAITLDQRVFGSKAGILNDFPPSKKSAQQLTKITVLHLLQHSAGWDRDLFGDVVFFPMNKITNRHASYRFTFREQLIKYMMTQKTQYIPGKHHAYSNFGYLVLGCIIEKVTEMPYIDYISSILHSTEVKNILIGHEKKVYTDYNEGKDIYEFYDSGVSGFVDSVETKVEYFEDVTEPTSSIFAHEGALLQPQYGGLRMRDAAAYGGLVASAIQLLNLFSTLNYDLPQTKNHILSEIIAKKMLERPNYEVFDYWYGLGLDIQDNGETWGHSGHMDGSSSTFCKHRSGLSWVLLFNSGSKDMDLDGLVKYGLTLVPNSPISETVSISSSIKRADSDVRIVSSDKAQIVHLLLPLQELDAHVNELKTEGYKITEINLVAYYDKVYVSTVWHRNVNQNEFFVKTVNQSYKDPHYEWLESDIKGYSEEGYRVTSISTCCYQPLIVSVIVLEKILPKTSQLVFFARRDWEAFEKYNSENNTHQLIKQSVCRIAGHNYVTAVLEKEEKNVKNKGHISCLQMTADNFIFELQRQAQKKIGLISLHCFSDVLNTNKIFASAIWSPSKKNNCYQRYHMSRYGFFYELAQSAEKNVRLEYLSAYINEGVLNFAAIWAAGPFSKAR